MYVKRNLTLPFILRYTWPALVGSVSWASLTLVGFFVLGLTWIDVPFELVSVMGIAVAFFVGFKNNQAYDRFWEARKIWGSIVNLSRAWTAQVLTLPAAGMPADPDGLRAVQTSLVYRHLAWINALRVQLRQSSGFGVRENLFVKRFVAAHQEAATVPDVIKPFVDPAEGSRFSGRRNVATNLVLAQAEQVKSMRRSGMIDAFGQMLLLQSVQTAYDLQGMCERIKNTPFPRQYAFFSQLFTIVFCLLLPLGLLDVYEDELRSTQPSGAMLVAMVGLSALVSWIFVTWERIGDSSEDPFEGLPHDVSMSALCRTIEIDLRDMLDEDDLPAKLQPQGNILY